MKILVFSVLSILYMTTPSWAGFPWTWNMQSQSMQMPMTSFPRNFALNGVQQPQQLLNCMDKSNCESMCINSFSRPSDQETCKLACNGNHGGAVTKCLDPPNCQTFECNGPGDDATNCVCQDPGKCQFYKCSGKREGDLDTTYICQDPPTCRTYKGNHVRDSETTCVCNDAPTCHSYKCNGVVIGRDQWLKIEWIKEFRIIRFEVKNITIKSLNQLTGVIDLLQVFFLKTDHHKRCTSSCNYFVLTRHHEVTCSLVVSLPVNSSRHSFHWYRPHHHCRHHWLLGHRERLECRRCCFNPGLHWCHEGFKCEK